MLVPGSHPNLNPGSFMQGTDSKEPCLQGGTMTSEFLREPYLKPGRLIHGLVAEWAHCFWDTTIPYRTESLHFWGTDELSMNSAN